MKKIILFCLIIYAEAFAQTGSTVEIKKIFCDWRGSVVFIDSVETIIRDKRGNVIQPSTDFYYEYHAITNLLNDPNEDIFGDFGLNKAQRDNDLNIIQTWYVIVKDSVNHTFCDTSNTVSFQIETTSTHDKRIDFKALQSNGSIESGAHPEHVLLV